MKIAILGAMQEEILPILEKVAQYQTIQHAQNTFYLAKYAGHELIIAYSKIGKVASAMTASILFERFNAEILLFSGVAGGLDESLKIGDIVFATKLVQHDADLSAFSHPLGYIPQSNHYTNSDSRLNDIAKKIAKMLNIDLKQGIIASADQFIASKEKKEWIKRTFNAIACEMEGASVAQVCSFYEKPFFLLRAISDTASGDADVLFDEFLQSSAKISAEFILKMVENI